MSKGEYKSFYISKGVKSNSQRTPIKGYPNTNLDSYNIKTGRFKSRRKFGPDGYAKIDLDVGHFDHNYDDHVHDFDEHIRKNARPLNKKEKRELNKAKRKRKFYD